MVKCLIDLGGAVAGGSVIVTFSPFMCGIKDPKVLENSDKSGDIWPMLHPSKKNTNTPKTIIFDS